MRRRRLGRKGPHRMWLSRHPSRPQRLNPRRQHHHHHHQQAHQCHRKESKTRKASRLVHLGPSKGSSQRGHSTLLPPRRCLTATQQHVPPAEGQDRRRSLHLLLQCRQRPASVQRQLGGAPACGQRKQDLTSLQQRQHHQRPPNLLGRVRNRRTGYPLLSQQQLRSSQRNQKQEVPCQALQQRTHHQLQAPQRHSRRPQTPHSLQLIQERPRRWHHSHRVLHQEKREAMQAMRQASLRQSQRRQERRLQSQQQLSRPHQQQQSWLHQQQGQ
mmetsp:Transcript_29302/g.75947  ORF Transcript_29302/g.75947 Transcript_29302/m.75947 type:complete len:271 (+) Transcript_29302:1502-2314(+)